MGTIVAATVGLILGLVLALVGAIISALPVMWLWNAVIPAVFGLRALTWLQALWLCLLCAFLLGTPLATREKA